MKHIFGVLLLVSCMLLQPGLAQEQSWYKCLKGAIDKYPVTVNLHKMGDSYAGYYYYNSKQEPVYFVGNDTTKTGMVTLYAFAKSPDNENEVFSIANSDSVFNGTWKRTPQSKPLNCSLKLSNDNSLMPFRLIYHYNSKELKPGMQESPSVSFDAATIWPATESGAAELVKEIVRETFGNEKFESDPQGIFQKLEDQYFDEYLQGYKDVTDEEIKDHPYGFSTQEVNKVMVVYQTKKLLTLSNFTYSYTGGAHGNYSTAYITLDLVNKKALHMDEVLTEAGEKQIPGLLEKYFRKAYNVPAKSKLTDAGLFENKIENNENFCATGKGLFFSYAPYEIGPYAMGEITLFIPFSELQPYIKPKFKALLQ